MHFFDLPVEVRNRIMDYAYAHDGKTRRNLIFRHESIGLWAPAKKPNYSPFPTWKINHFLVSKQWFREAAKAWMEAHSFSETVVWARPHSCPSNAQQFIEGEFGIFHEYGKSATVIYSKFWKLLPYSLTQCESLKNLKIILSSKFLDDIRPESQPRFWKRQLDNDELLQLLENSGLSLLRGLKTFTIARRLDYFQGELTHNKYWRQGMLWDNIERLEELAREIVTAPADDVEKASPDDDSLYKGSKVLYSRKTPSKAFEASQRSPVERADFPLWQRHSENAEGGAPPRCEAPQTHFSLQLEKSL